MRVLIACEFSGVVREAFKAKGHDAWSCDLLPTNQPGQHIQGDVLDILDDGWDLMVAHPPCTYFSLAGMHYLRTQPERRGYLSDSFVFWLALYNSNINKLCMENPCGWLNTYFKKPCQTIHPYYFGDSALKRTCLWLQNLPLLSYRLQDDLFGKATSLLKPKPEGVYIRKSGLKIGQKFNKQWRDGKSAKDRSVTFPAIANAMAEQWG